MAKTDNYYAVARGRKIGIYRTWTECQAQVDGFQRPRFKKFGSESEARQFIAQNIEVAGTVAPSSNNLAKHKKDRKRNIVEKSEEVDVKRAKIDESASPVDDNQIVVYTDGACSNNGRANAKAGWGVYWGPDHPRNDYGPLSGEATNNRAELVAVKKALETGVKHNIGEMTIRTDSKLLIQSLNSWISGWRRNGWKTSSGSVVKNRDLLEEIDDSRKRIKVNFEHVAGHAGIEGNEKADELARMGAELYKK